LIVVVSMVAAVGFAAMCGNHGMETPTPDTGSTQGPSADDQGRPTQLPSAFSFTDMTDWNEAERVVGFEILRSKTLSLAWGNFVVQPSVELPGKVPRKVIAIYKVGGYDVRFTAAPAASWPAGALDSGEPLEIERWKGRLSLWEEHAGAYTFPCGVSKDFGDVWCLVEFDARSIDTLVTFVRDLTS